MKTTNVRERAAELAERCGCRTWQAHWRAAIWQLEKEIKRARTS